MERKLYDTFVKSATVGAVGAIVARADNYLVFGDKLASRPIEVYGMKVNFATLMAVTFFASSLVAELAANYIFPELHVSERMANIVAQSLNVGLLFGSTVVLLNMVKPEAVQALGLFNLLAISVAVEAAAQYLYSSWLYPTFLAK